MKRETLRRSSRNSNNKNLKKNCGIMMKGSLANHFTVQLDQVSLNLSLQQKSSQFQNRLDSEANPSAAESLSQDIDAGDKDFILSQDFFW